MGSFRNTVTIDRPVDEVFAYVADFENVPTWNYAIAETRKSTPGPVAVGTTFVQRRQIPKPSEERFTVTELAPGRSVAVGADRRHDLNRHDATASRSCWQDPGRAESHVRSAKDDVT